MVLESVKTYACYNADEQIRYSSTSGGLFLALCRVVINNGGFVAGVVFDDEFNSIHYITNKYDECTMFLGSKYPQSQINYIYSDIKKIVNKGTLVLFSGTPCQVAAIKKIVGNSDKLLCVDIICMGVASPEIWQEYLKNSVKNDRIETIRFKDKKYGWKKYSVVIKTDKREISEIGGRNTFMSAYVGGYQMRDSCYKCKFKGRNRYSDITIADCWGIEDFLPHWDTYNGVSVAFINTELGSFFFQDAKKFLVNEEISYDDAIKMNPYYSISKEKPTFISLFWFLFQFNKKLFFWFYKANSFHYRLIRKIKNVLRVY